MKANLIDERQRCMEDGCAENITILAALLHEAKTSLKELHITSLDVTQAFPSVSHEALAEVMGELGLPLHFIRYMRQTYENSATILEIGSVSSEEIRVRKGVRQGDPLSTLAFCMVVDKMLRAVPQEVGFDLAGEKVNDLAYADDIIKISSTKLGMQESLEISERVANSNGLHFNLEKCSSLSIVPAGKEKKYKVVTEPQFVLNAGNIRQLTPTQEWRYLGINFSALGVRKVGRILEEELARISTAPLKPQQRLKVLKCFLIPRYYHTLVLSKCTKKILKALDRQVHIALRKWFRFPHDVPVAYFHAACVDGGMGIPSFLTTIPGLMRKRMTGLRTSSSSAARQAYQTQYVQRMVSWAKKALTIDGVPLFTEEERRRYWANRLHESTDGGELRESGRTKLSSRWMDVGSSGIPGRDYVQFHHVHINCLPTRIRTSRGQRANKQISCRAGCNSTETAAHIIQGCSRTHGGRIRRHNAISKTLANSLRQKGWQVTEEPRLLTTGGLLKPDLVVCKGDTCKIIDTQIVSGATSLDEAHQRKVAKYDTREVKSIVAREHGVERERVSVTSCTISWRGVWSARSAVQLQELELTKAALAGLTTRVLQGSHTNWSRWNEMTTRTDHRARTGIG